MLKELFKRAEELDWTVDYDKDDESVTFSQYSPAGQDFSFTVSCNNEDKLLDIIKNYYENYDISYETYIWLGNDGHGKNGAPYDMKDLYDDMESCQNAVENLYDELIKYKSNLEENLNK